MQHSHYDEELKKLSKDLFHAFAEIHKRITLEEGKKIW
jgi:hypothetical protein